MTNWGYIKIGYAIEVEDNSTIEWGILVGKDTLLNIMFITL